VGQSEVVFVSVPTAGLPDSPAVVVDRLRSRWINPGVYLILEGVVVQIPEPGGPEGNVRTEEHALAGVEIGPGSPADVVSLLASEGLGQPTLWARSTVVSSVNQAGEFALAESKAPFGGAIHQRLADALPSSYVVLSNAGRFFLKAGNRVLAREFLAPAFEMAPEVPEVAINYLTLLSVEGRELEAQALWGDIERKHPDHPAVRALKNAGP